MEPSDLQAQGLVFERPTHQVVDDIDVLCAPEGYELHSLEQYRQQPQRQTGSVTLHTPASFVAYTKEGDPKHGRVFINAVDRAFVAVLNHGTPETPDWRDHRARYQPDYSLPYNAWTAFVKSPCNQTQMIQFLEEHAADIGSLRAADILELVRDFRVASNGSFTSAQDLNTGSIQFNYAIENRGAGAVEIPDQLTLNVPVFEGTDPVAVVVRFRYRLKEGALTFHLEIAQREQLERDEFDKIRAGIEQGLNGWTIFDGFTP